MRYTGYFLWLLFLTVPSFVWGGTLNVLVLKRAPRVEFSFAQNYAVVINGDHFYGPVAKENNFKLENVSGALLLSVRDAKTGRYKSLGKTRDRVDVVRSLGAAAAMSRPVPVKNLRSRALAPGAAGLEREAEKGGRFISFKHPQYGGVIAYEGPFSAFARQGGVDLVETAELERYVTQVVACELGAEKSLEALKTQSVLSRSFAVYTVQARLKAVMAGNKNWRNFQLLAEPSDQAYNCKKRVGDREPPSALVKKATAQTRGQILLKNGRPVLAQYQGANPKNPVKGAVNQQAVIRLAKQGGSYRNILARFFKGVRVGEYQADFSRELAKARLRTEFQKS